MVRPASIFRHFKTYSRKQLEIHSFPKLKSGGVCHDRKHDEFYVRHSDGTSRTEFEIRKEEFLRTARADHQNYARLQFEQSGTNRTFEKNRHVNKIDEQMETSPNSDAIETLPLHNYSKLSAASIEEEMDCDSFHWGATAEVVEIIRRRDKSPETRRLVERKLEIARPGTMRRRYNQNAQRTIWVPSRPKRSKEEIAETDGELIQHANRLGGGGKAINQSKNLRRTGPNPNGRKTPGGSVIRPGERRRESNSLPIVDLKNYNTEGKGAHNVQFNQIIRVVTEGKKIAEETIKKRQWTLCWT